MRQVSLSAMSRCREAEKGAAAARLRSISQHVRGDVSLMLGGDGQTASLRVEATALVASCLGNDHHLVTKLDQWTPVTALNRFSRTNPSDELCGYIDAAVALIGTSDSRSTMTPACEPELWSHVEGLFVGEMWDKIPSAVVTFVEDWFRRSAGNPANKKGGKLYGSGLFAEILRPDGPHALGSDMSEMQGWRDLGQGLAKAIGNGHRHTLQNRVDAERLAWNVVGLGSLLIGEMRREHGGDPLSGH
jgi:hypothetical protein